MPGDYAAKQTDKELARLERRLSLIYAESKADLDEAVDRYYNGWDEVVFDKKKGEYKTVHHRGMKERYAIEYKAYLEGKYHDPSGKYTDEEMFNRYVWAQEGRGKHIEAMRDAMAKNMTETNIRAAAMINDTTPGIYSLNANWEAYKIEVVRKDDSGNWKTDSNRRNMGNGLSADVSFNLVREQTIKELATDRNHVEFRVNSVNRKRDYEWNKDQITRALTAGILQGESPYKIADRYMVVMQRNKVAAIRNARTSITSAQNAGVQHTYDRAVEMGIELQKQWMATMNDRTRDSHIIANGQHVDVDKKFHVGSSEMDYPGDPSAPPEEAYNCRCTMVTLDPAVLAMNSDPYDVKGFEEWVKEKEEREGRKIGETKQQDPKKKEAKEKTKQNKPNYSDMDAKQIDAYGREVIFKHWEEYRQKNIGYAVPVDFSDNDFKNGESRYNTVHLGGVIKNNEIVGKIIETVDSLENEFYSPLEKLSFSRDKMFVLSNAGGYTQQFYASGHAEIVLNPKFYTQNGLKKIAESSQTGYHINIPEGREAEYIITHEFAHSIMSIQDKLPSNKKNWVQHDLTNIKKARKEIEDIYSEYTVNLAKAEKEYRDFDDKINLNFIINMVEPTEEEYSELTRLKKNYESIFVSKYGNTMADEFMAESFTDCRFNGDNAKEYSKKVYSVIKKYFGK